MRFTWDTASPARQKSVDSRQNRHGDELAFSASYGLTLRGKALTLRGKALILVVILHLKVIGSAVAGESLGRFLHLLMARQKQLSYLICRSCRTKQKALHFAAPLGANFIQLLLRLDAFGDRRHAQALG